MFCEQAPAGSTTPEKAVRIYVCFEEAASASTAFTFMNGRFFSGRRVAARLCEESDIHL